MKQVLLFLLGGGFILMLTSQSIWANEKEKTESMDASVTVIHDLAYTRDNDKRRMLDLYLPKNGKSPLPVILLIHGGGWCAGNKESFGDLAQKWASHGYAVASMNYRFSDKAIFPAQVIDAKAAVRWLRAHTDTYGLDSKRIAVGGHSAGGHLAAFLAVTNGIKKFDKGENLRFSSNVQACIWLSGVGDFVTRVLMPGGYESEAAADSGESKLIGGAVLENRDKALAASPIHFVSTKSAPFIFFHGDKDECVHVSQAIEMYVALERAGVYGELHLIKGATHGNNEFWSALDMDSLITPFLNKVWDK